VKEDTRERIGIIVRHTDHASALCPPVSTALPLILTYFHIEKKEEP